VEFGVDMRTVTSRSVEDINGALRSEYTQQWTWLGRLSLKTLLLQRVGKVHSSLASLL
jgi:hypothetical protein